MITEQRFHDSPVLKVRIRQASSHASIGLYVIRIIIILPISDTQDILIIYPRIVVRMEFKSLSLFINEKLKHMNQKNNDQQPFDQTFTYNKWFLSAHDRVADACSFCTQSHNLY